MSINDFAILYQTKILKLKRKLDVLNSVGIKGEKYFKELAKIENDINLQVEDYNKDIKNQKLYLKDLNSIYNNGIAKLELLENSLLKYDSYIRGYHYCEYLDSKINGERVSNWELDEYANDVIKYINAINETDTRDYNEEKEIVEKVYGTAYQIMKLLKHLLIMKLLRI